MNALSVGVYVLYLVIYTTLLNSIQGADILRGFKIGIPARQARFLLSEPQPASFPFPHSTPNIPLQLPPYISTTPTVEPRTKQLDKVLKNKAKSSLTFFLEVQGVNEDEDEDEDEGDNEDDQSKENPKPDEDEDEDEPPKKKLEPKKLPQPLPTTNAAKVKVGSLKDNPSPSPSPSTSPSPSPSSSPSPSPSLQKRKPPSGALQPEPEPEQKKVEQKPTSAPTNKTLSGSSSQTDSTSSEVGKWFGWDKDITISYVAMAAISIGGCLIGCLLGCLCLRSPVGGPGRVEDTSRVFDSDDEEE